MIDREKVIRGLECCLASKYPPCGECGYDGDMNYNDPWSCRLSLMADALALLKEQEPVVHGWWIKSKLSAWPIMMCSACGEPFTSSEKTAFCPHCGAKMDGERRDEDD